jgi:hypothetical protein
MCATEARVKSDDGDPSGDETAILARQHARSRSTSCAEQELARSFLGRPKLAFYRLAAQLELSTPVEYRPTPTIEN